MCGNSNRPAFGGTIAVLLPQPGSNSVSEGLLSSSPQSVSSLSSTGSMSSYSLFFRESENKTKAIFQMEDEDTYDAIRGFGNINVRIEKYGHVSSSSQCSPLHEFRLNIKKDEVYSEDAMQMEFELPEKLDLAVSDKGVIGRQVTVHEGGSILGVGIVGYN